MFTLGSCVLLSLVLFSIGTYGVIARRNLLIVLMSVELMLNGANLALVAFSRYFAAGGLPAIPPPMGGPAGLADGGQVFVLMSMAVAACEIAVGLAIVIALFRLNRSVMTVDAVELRG
ncbi:NADH-quinone oxidoreductase subunit NuoK [Planctomycetota bacterium]